MRDIQIILLNSNCYANLLMRICKKFPIKREEYKIKALQWGLRHFDPTLQGLNLNHQTCRYIVRIGQNTKLEKYLLDKMIFSPKQSFS